MGIIKAIAGAIGGGLADQWLEVIEPNDMGGNTVFTNGVTVRQGDKRNSNFKGTGQTISNGSIIHVYDSQFMMLVDGGKIVDYTAEPGYYKVNNSSLPSLFNGQLGDTVKETFSRFKFSGTTPTKQQVFYINLQEIKGNPFGTANPVMYYDAKLDADLYIRARGRYSIKITDPIKFYQEVIPRNAEKVEYSEISDQYRSEFLSAFQSAINQMSADGISIRTMASKGTELGEYMRDVLDEEWNSTRGFEVCIVGVDGITYDEKSQEILAERSRASVMSDPRLLNAQTQLNISEGIRDSGKNAGGAMAGFLGVGMGMQAGGNFLNAANEANQKVAQQQAAQQQSPLAAAAGVAVAAGWKCECGATNTGKFCAECGKPQPQAPAGWVCSCGTTNTGKFCAECGKPQPPKKIKCDKCGFEPDISNGIPKFCPECGDAIDDSDKA